GDRIIGLTSYLPLFSFGMLCFALSRVFMTYYLAKKVYLFSVVSFLFSIVLLIALSLFHDSLQSVVNVMAFVGMTNLMVLTLMHFFSASVLVIENNALAVLELFRNKYFPPKRGTTDKLNILFMNWR